DPGTEPGTDPGTEPGTDPDDNGPSMELEHDVREHGQEQVAHGYGFQPGETVTGTMFSSPYALGSQVADDNGEVTFTWNVQSDAELGDHTVELAGATSGTVDDEFKVVAMAGTDSDGGDELPATGVDMGGMLPIASLLLLAGIGIVVATRRSTVRG
ncbi:MAG: LPXTG cell wall anchor domain-containing protein, partial [Microbacterium sp.]